MFRFALLLLIALLIALSAPSFSGEAEGQPVPRGNYIVVLNDSVANPRAVAAQQARMFGGEVGFVYQHALKGYSVTLPTPAIRALEANPLVRFVSEDKEITVNATPPVVCTDVTQCQLLTRGVDRIDGELSSTRSGDGRRSVDIDVAVIDSGVDPAHPDLNVVGGTNCTNEKGPVSNPHGTMVAGVIGAKDNGVGIVGIAPDARLWSVRVLKKNGTGLISALICGIDWVTATRTDSHPGNDIEVANMSIGGAGEDDGNCGLTNGDVEHRALCKSVAMGVNYVVSAGNDSVNIVERVAASYDEVLIATAMTDTDGQPGGLTPPAETPSTCLQSFAPDGYTDDSAAAFSNFATEPLDQAHTLAAPGTCVVSTGIFDPALPNQLGVGPGTSFAAPYIAGTVALCIASGPCAGLTPAQIIQKVVADAAAYNNAHPEYGFAGDPLRPIAGKYYGYLIRAAQY